MEYLHDNVGERKRVPLRPSRSLISRRYIPAWINENIAFLIEFAPLRLQPGAAGTPGLPGRSPRGEPRGSDFNDDLVSHASLPVKDQREKDFDVFPDE